MFHFKSRLQERIGVLWPLTFSCMGNRELIRDRFCGKKRKTVTNAWNRLSTGLGSTWQPGRISRDWACRVLRCWLEMTEQSQPRVFPGVGRNIFYRGSNHGEVKVFRRYQVFHLKFSGFRERAVWGLVMPTHTTRVVWLTQLKFGSKKTAWVYKAVKSPSDNEQSQVKTVKKLKLGGVEQCDSNP